jgi:hypothetical protein
MSRTASVAIAVLAVALSVMAYDLYRNDASESLAPSTPLQSQETSAQSATSQRQEPSPKIPPVPPGGAQVSAPTPEPAPEPTRVLVGIAGEQLRQIEQYLPEGSHVATYPLDNAHERAAILIADIDGDGSPETVVVHTEQLTTSAEPMPQLYLTVLSRDAESIKVRSSVRLANGGVLFNIEIGGVRVPLAAQDVTGDGRPEILVASGVGALLGGELQLYAVERDSLRRIGDISGHSFYLRDKDANRVEILARWMEEPQVTIYEWDGHDFKAVSKMPFKAK